MCVRQIFKNTLVCRNVDRHHYNHEDVTQNKTAFGNQKNKWLEDHCEPCMAHGQRYLNTHCSTDVAKKCNSKPTRPHTCMIDSLAVKDSLHKSFIILIIMSKQWLPYKQTIHSITLTYRTKLESWK